MCGCSRRWHSHREVLSRVSTCFILPLWDNRIKTSSAPLHHPPTHPVPPFSFTASLTAHTQLQHTSWFMSMHKTVFIWAEFLSPRWIYDQQLWTQPGNFGPASILACFHSQHLTNQSKKKAEAGRLLVWWGVVDCISCSWLVLICILSVFPGHFLLHLLFISCINMSILAEGVTYCRRLWPSVGFQATKWTFTNHKPRKSRHCF